MMWHLAGADLYELGHPQGDRTPLEVIGEIQTKTSLGISEVLDLMRVSTSAIH
jgi:hypothetical protein